MTYVRMLEDQNGDLVEIEHYCSVQCWLDAGLENPQGNYWPCPEAADYDQYCPTCGSVAVHALCADHQTG